VALSTPGGRPPLRLILAHRFRQWLMPPLVMGVIAWLVSMPLIAFHFEQLNPWAVIASLLLALPVFFALTAGFLKILLTLVFPFGEHWWASLAAIPVSWMRHGVDWLTLLPGSDVPLPAHSILFIFVYYGLILLPLAPIAWPRMRTMVRWSPALAVMLLVMIPLTGGATSAPRGTLRITALAVGAGQCCVMELPDGRVILLDAGSATLSDPVHKCISPFLRDHGISNIDEIWLADCDYDHICAAAELIRAFHVPRVVFSTRFEHDATGKPADELLFEQIRASGVSVRRYSRGDHVEIGKGVSFDVLWPSVSASWPRLTNDNDLVLKLTYARRTILFPSDIQQSTQAALLTDRSQLHCDAMLAPHHGSGETTTPAFIAAADPLFIVSSNDRTLTQKQRLFERQAGKRELLRTNRCGATTITIDRNGGLNVVPYLDADQQQ
jgi:competence protein ComEC